MDKRANMLQGEARDADRIYGGHIGENVGPVERKLLQFGDVIGLVVGAFGEGSEDLHDLVQQMAESRATSMELKRGREATDAEIGISVSLAHLCTSSNYISISISCWFAGKMKRKMRQRIMSCNAMK